MLHQVYDSNRIFVNSFHHQAVGDTGKHLRATAKAADGVVEAIESSEHKPIMGVQWHPEWLEADGGKLFAWLIEQASLFMQAKQNIISNFAAAEKGVSPVWSNKQK